MITQSKIVRDFVHKWNELKRWDWEFASMSSVPRHVVDENNINSVAADAVALWFVGDSDSIVLEGSPEGRQEATAEAGGNDAEAATCGGVPHHARSGEQILAVFDVSQQRQSHGFCVDK